MPDTELMWSTIKELGAVGLIIAAIGYVAVIYIKTNPRKHPEQDNDDEKCRSCEKSTCAEQILPYLADSIKTNAELVVVLRDQQTESRRTAEKQQEAMQGMILAITTQVALCRETLDRVKEIR